MLPRIALSLAFCLSLSASITRTPPGCATRPCVYLLDTAATTADATENGELQTVLDEAERGDTIQLTAGKIWTATGGSLSGSFDIYDVAGSSGYLTITTTESAKLPPAGTRITPSHAVNMARLQLSSSTNNAVVRFSAGAAAAQYVRFTGIEFYNPSLGYVDNSGLDIIRIGNPGTVVSAASLPNFIEFVSCYIHANTTAAAENRNAILANGKNITIQDSWISEIKMSNSVETHAVVWYDTPGPVTITNTWLEAAAIPILIGGGPQTVLDATMRPDNTTLLRNTFHKPLKWYSLSPDYTGVVYRNKNMVEWKIGDNNLLQYNSFFNNFFGPTNDQAGQIIAVNIRLPDGCTIACDSFAKTDNTLIRDNHMKGSLGVFSVLGTDNNFADTGIVDNLNVTNNLAWDISCSWSYLGCIEFSVGPQFYRHIGGGRRLSFTNNTIAADTDVGMYFYWNGGSTSAPDVSGLIFNNNISLYGGNGWKADGTAAGEASVDARTDASTYPVDIRGNTMSGSGSTSWDTCTAPRLCGNGVYPTPANFIANTAQLWRDPVNGDFTYQTASAYRNNGLNGALMGADMSTIPRIYGVSVSPGSTKVVLSYRTSPILSTQGCSLEVSTSNNLITSLGSYSVVNDVNPTNSGYDLQSRAGNIQDGINRQFVIGRNSSLSPSTLYYYRILCGPEFATGSFTTLSSGGGYTATIKYSTARTGEYSANADMSSPTAIPSSTTHTVPVPTGTVRYYRQTGGPIQIYTGK